MTEKNTNLVAGVIGVSPQRLSDAIGEGINDSGHATNPLTEDLNANGYNIIGANNIAVNNVLGFGATASLVALPGTTFGFAGNELTGVGSPTASNSASNKAYVDSGIFTTTMLVTGDISPFTPSGSQLKEILPLPALVSADVDVNTTVTNGIRILNNVTFSMVISLNIKQTSTNADQLIVIQIEKNGLFVGNSFISLSVNGTANASSFTFPVMNGVAGDEYLLYVSAEDGTDASIEGVSVTNANMEDVPAGSITINKHELVFSV